MCVVGEDERAYRSDGAWPPDPLSAALRSGPVSLHSHGERLQADAHQDPASRVDRGATEHARQ